MNLFDLAADLDRAANTATVKAARHVTAVALEVKQAQEAAVPERTGKLSEAITITGAGGGAVPAVPDQLEVGPDRSAPGGGIGVLAEFGSSRHGPQPFVFPSAEGRDDTLARRVGDDVGNI